MKNRNYYNHTLLLFLLLLLAVTTLGCSSFIRSEKGETSQEKQSKMVEAQWTEHSFDDVIRCCTHCFTGTVLSCSTIEEEQVFVVEVLVNNDLTGRLSGQKVYCHFLNEESFGGAKGKEYEIGKEYLFLTEKQVSLFYSYDRYSSPSDYCLNLTDNVYRHMDKKLTFSNPDEICRYLKERIVVRENREPTEKTDGDWSDADFIAIIRLKSVFHKASANFSGTAYVAEIVEMEQGRNEDIVWFQEQSMLITLDDRKTQVGGTYRVGFSLKNGATMVYTQEGTETITLMDE